MRGVARKTNKKKTPEMFKIELLASVVILDGEEDYLELKEEVKNAKEPKDGVALVKKI